jgi:hypothetical protein
MSTIQKADPGARRKAIWVICATTLLGVCTILALESFQEEFQSLLERNIDFLVKNSIIVFLVSWVLVSPVLAAGTYLLSIGNRTVRAQRFPPPGYAVVRDTHVIGGSQGRQRGRVIQWLSLLLLFSAAAIPFVMWLVFRSLASRI